MGVSSAAEVAEIFEPEFHNCEHHGKYQVSFDTPDGIRWDLRCPECMTERRIDNACIPARFLDKFFKNYNVCSDGQNEALSLAREYVQKFAESSPPPSLVFLGRPGTGKTHLATAILKNLIRQGYTGRYTTAMGLVREIRATWSKDSDASEGDIIARFSCVDLLLLDEVGVQCGSIGEQNILFEIIDRRYGSCRPTIIVSNENLEGLTAFVGERALDRLRENGGRVVVFDWESYRGER